MDTDEYDDDANPFSNFNPCVDTPKDRVVTSPETIMKNRLEQFSVSHTDMNEESWLKWVSSNLLKKSDSRICRILHYHFSEVNALLIVEESQIVSQKSVLNAFAKADNSTLEHKTVILENCLKFDRGATQFYLSSHLVETVLVIKHKEKQTIAIPAPTLVNILGSLFSVTIKNIPSYTHHSKIPHIIRHSEIQKQFDHAGDSIESLATSVDRLRRQTQAMMSANFEDGIDMLAEIGEIKIRIGHLTENATRQRVALRYGMIWAESVTIKSFNELVDFVGISLGADTSSIDLAREMIIHNMMVNFCGMEKAVDDKINWKDLDLYSRTVRWIDAANHAPGSKSSGYSPHLLRLMDIVNIHRMLSNLNLPNLHDEIIKRLYYQDTIFALVLFWIYLSDEDKFKSSKDEFSKWELPHLELEFDHRGSFSEVPICFTKSRTSSPMGILYYSGGETKSNCNAINDATFQLERRFMLIDGVLNAGFNRSAAYCGHVFLPYLPSAQKSRTIRSLNLRRQIIPQSVDNTILDGLVNVISQDNQVVSEVSRKLLSRSKVFVRRMNGNVWFSSDLKLEENYDVIENLMKWLKEDPGFNITSNNIGIMFELATKYEITTLKTEIMVLAMQKLLTSFDKFTFGTIFGLRSLIADSEPFVRSEFNEYSRTHLRTLMVHKVDRALELMQTMLVYGSNSPPVEGRDTTGHIKDENHHIDDEDEEMRKHGLPVLQIVPYMLLVNTISMAL